MEQKIGIVGAGCIGSSLARDIRALGLGHVTLYDHNPHYMRLCRDLNLADSYAQTLAEVAGTSELIFVCVPVRIMADVIAEIASLAHEHTLITDVGSLKSCIIDSVSPRLKDKIYYLPGHPITAGTIAVGPEGGREGIFINAPYLLTAFQEIPHEIEQKLITILTAIGAKITYMNAAQHDKILGFTSHLSHFIAFSIMNAAQQLSDDIGVNVFDYAGGSFRDVTRVAGADINMWRDIFMMNKVHLKDLYAILLNQTDLLKKFLEDDDTKSLEEFLSKAHHLRSLLK